MLIPPPILPEFLDGVVSQEAYAAWIKGRARQLFQRDKQRKQPYVKTANWYLYREKIHEAVVICGTFDRYSGDTLRWELINTWSINKSKTDPDIFRNYALMPTVDHVDPQSQTLELEICSWVVNLVKGYLAPEQFVALCRKIVAYREKSALPPIAALSSIDVDTLKPVSAWQRFVSNLLCRLQLDNHGEYKLPPFLEGICLQKVYTKWHLRRAISLYQRDKKAKRNCVLYNTISDYRQAICNAVALSSLKDPYTGDTMRWDLIGTWTSTKGSDGSDSFKRNYALLPTVDHVDTKSKVLVFEICSWQINSCRNDLTSEEFVDLCKKISGKSPLKK